MPVTRLTRLDLYVAVVAVMGIGTLVASALATPWEIVTSVAPAGAVVFLLAVSIPGELKPIILRVNGRESRSLGTSTPAVLALLPIAGAVIAMIAHVAAGLVLAVRRRSDARRILFNTGQNVLTVLVAAALYSGLTGTPLLEPTRDIGAGDVAALLVAGVASVVANHLLVCGAVALSTSRSFWPLVARDLRFLVVTQLVLLSVAGVAVGVAPHNPVSLVLLVVPLFAAHVFASTGARHAHDARHDRLTGLGNRAQFRDELEDALDYAARRDEEGPGLVLVDLDHFKDFNDTLGHPVGDAILREIATRLVASLPEQASVHRLGGDEFAVVVRDGVDGTERVARTLLDSFTTPVLVDTLELLVRGSAGVAVAPRHGADEAALMKNADIALYHAKLERDRVSTYSPDFAVNTVERLQLIVDLRTALEERRLHVEYQPQIDLTTGATVGVEALARWRHPEHGPVGPDEFVPLAENSGLIFGLTELVLDIALADLARWRAGCTDVRLAVNLSARHLADLSIVAMVSNSLARHDVPASALVLEVTETAIFSDPVRADKVLRALRDLGVAIAIDDYGTGNASLSYLRRVEVDELKIDRAFVSRMSEDPRDRIIVRSTVELALGLGLRVVAEGIEDEATGAAIGALGDVIGQGYHYSRPVVAGEICARLAREDHAEIMANPEKTLALSATSRQDVARPTPPGLSDN
ncbi:putative bifunctional diguanylate cyclase/phosphodiesterase [Demequina mangrovi]|uniref:Diguanylate cyclase (GGDEF) domain-containing protein n=1 Tax=Demequina mangrovi TaxID=1043493 RepID=A0A1H7A2H2_9MICO|nr:bifunctional diguanylate cyclase/phosphodiesterase [Demequina mangrovi]SEJ59771.1 diguanylate cyclase (GGDEF) domain-containing protein [Demequina mangrovi]